MLAIIIPATMPLSAEFMVEESCCWYACANSMTFFARIMTPTAPMTAITSVFKLSTNHEVLSQPIMKIGGGWLHYCFSFLS